MKSNATKDIEYSKDELVNSFLHDDKFSPHSKIIYAKHHFPENPFFSDDTNTHKYIKDNPNFLADFLYINSDDFHRSRIWLLTILQDSCEIKNMVLHPKSGCNIDSDFENFLCNAKHLENLSLCSTLGTLYTYKMEARQINHLSCGLRKNTALKTLDISYQDIYDQGLNTILDALKQNPESKLEYINLAYCRLTNISAKALLAHIKESNSLLNVNIQGNDGISDELIQSINLAIQQKQFSVNATDSQIEIIIDEPSPGPITYAYIESKNNEQEIEMTNTNDMDCISKKHNRM